MTCRLIGRSCVINGCMRPARELGGYCTRCWMNLSPARRLALQEGGDTEPIDPLEVLFALPARDEPGAKA